MAMAPPCPLVACPRGSRPVSTPAIDQNFFTSIFVPSQSMGVRPSKLQALVARLLSRPLPPPLVIPSHLHCVLVRSSCLIRNQKDLLEGNQTDFLFGVRLMPMLGRGTNEGTLFLSPAGAQKRNKPRLSRRLHACPLIKRAILYHF